MFRHVLSFVILVGACVSTSSFAATRLDLKYTSTQESKLGTSDHDVALRFVLTNDDVQVYDRTDGQEKLIATRAPGPGDLSGPADLTVTLTPDTVDLYASYISHTLHTHIIMDGQSTCTAVVTTKLKPDQTVYKVVDLKSGPVDVYKLTISRATCQLSRVDDPRIEDQNKAAMAAVATPSAAVARPNSDVKKLTLANAPAAKPQESVKPAPDAQPAASVPTKPATIAKAEIPEDEPAAAEAAMAKPAQAIRSRVRQKKAHLVRAKTHAVRAVRAPDHAPRARYRIASDNQHQSIRAAIRRFLIDNGY